VVEEIVCPECNRPSYTAVPYEPSPCPYCGFVFSKKDAEDEGAQVDRNTAKKMKGRILIIDDEPLVRDILTALLTGQGWEIDIAINGMEGLKMACERQYNVIISDINMPVMDGREFYRKLIEKIPSMKQRVLFITGNGDRETFMFLNKTGVKYLLKPFETMDILKAVNEFGDFTNSKTSRSSV